MRRANHTQLQVDVDQEGKLTESRLTESVYRILLQMFEQGLFENAYVDSGKAEDVVGSASFQQEEDDEERSSAVL
jgi:beta-glucosidase